MQMLAPQSPDFFTYRVLTLPIALTVPGEIDNLADRFSPFCKLLPRLTFGLLNDWKFVGKVDLYQDGIVA